jgi:ParB family transcriptional regulator, chromosome partitioning protein
MPSVLSINPFRCRTWVFHDRIENQLTESSCKNEIESISKHGQLMPALGRPLKGDPDFDVELIYGARRLFVARHLNQPLLVELREMSDRDAMVAMDVENRLRKDVSAYERALSYARCLRGGCFRSQEELAQSLRVSRAQMSRLLALAKLPAAVIGAFPDPREICETWGLELLRAVEDPKRRQLILDRARRLSAAPPARAVDVYNELSALPMRGKRRALSHEEIIRDERGGMLFRIREMRNDLALFVPTKGLSASRVTEIRNAVGVVLRRQKAEVVDSARRHALESPLIRRLPSVAVEGEENPAEERIATL